MRFGKNEVSATVKAFLETKPSSFPSCILNDELFIKLANLGSSISGLFLGSDPLLFHEVEHALSTVDFTLCILQLQLVQS